MAHEHEVYLECYGERKIDMKIGILASMINNFGEKGFYNSQEIGLAKMLSSKGNEVMLYTDFYTGRQVVA